MKNRRLFVLLLILFFTLAGGLFFLKVKQLWIFKSSVAQSKSIDNEPKEIDQVRIGVTWQSNKIYPENTAENMIIGFNSSVFETLVEFDNNIGNAVPRLASTWDNPDQLTWRFYLNPNAIFSDGSSVTADDVKFTYEYLKSHKLGMLDLIPAVKEIQVIDSKTIAFKTEIPDPVFLNRLGVNLLVMSKKDVEQNDLKNHLGSGPYKFGQITDQEIILIRNENYWGEKPKAKKIILKYIPDEIARSNALLNKEIDVDMYINNQTIDRLKTAAQNNEVQLLQMSHNNGIIYLSLDTTRDKTPYIDLPQNPLKDLRVRQAMEKGIDVNAIAKSIPTGAQSADQLVTSGIFGFNPDIKRLSYDPEGAKQLLKTAGFENGFTMTMDYLSINPKAKTTMNLVSQQLAQIGITVKLNPIEDIDRFYDKINGRDASAYRDGYSSDSKDACEVLSLIIHTTTGNYGNYNLGYSNAEVDRLIEAATLNSDPKTRRTYLQDAMKKSMDDVAVIPLIEEMDLFAYANNIVLNARQDGILRLEKIAGK